MVRTKAKKIPRRIIAARTKEQRKFARRAITLSRDRVKESTIVKYDKSLRFFFHYCDVNRIGTPTTSLELDLILCKYMDFLWEDGEAVDLAGSTLSAIEFRILPLRKKLSGAWKLIGCWRKLELPLQAPPLPVQVALALAGYGILIGDLGWAAGSLLMFHCFLRTGEAFALKGHHVCVKGDEGVVLLADTKKGMRDAVGIDCPLVRRLCQLRLNQISDDESFMGHSTTSGRVLFNRLIVFLDLQYLGLRLYSYRRGGATRFFRKTGNMETTLMRGRWESPRTAKQYITEGALTLAQLGFRDEQKELFAELAKLLRR